MIHSIIPRMSRWVVLKLGGTSVATAAGWRTIATIAERRIAEGLRPLLVCSAVAGTSDRLEAMLALAVEGRHGAALAEVRDRHLALGSELGLPAEELLAPELEELSRLALAASLLREAGAPLKARVLACGELMSTRLGAAFLAGRGVPAAWLDARTALVAREDRHPRAGSAHLAASCADDRDETLAARLAAGPAAAVVTQGSIAANAAGETVLLVGGADVAAACFAGRLAAERCEVWTGVPGLFTADPALLPSARLLRALDYEEAQEIATSGARVLHPRAIPPLSRHRIPLHVLSLDRPEAPGTVISAAGPAEGPQVKAISSRHGITLIAMETVWMWQEVGFLAEIFACFARHGLSIDAVSTSETNVTVSLDPTANAVEPAVLRHLLDELSQHCEPRLIAPAASLSLVGRGIRAILHELGPVLEAFEELEGAHGHPVGERPEPHLLRRRGGARAAGAAAPWPAFRSPGRGAGARSHLERARGGRRRRRGDQAGRVVAGPARGAPGARRRACADLRLRRATLEGAARSLLALSAVDRVFYSVKANNHGGALGVFHGLGLGFECVSVAEIEHLRALFLDLPGERILFTPNFASRDELARGFELGARVTVDSVYPLRAWPEIFRDREVFLRLDPGRGRGHHAHVKTAGAQSKFGIAVEQLDEAAALAAAVGARVVGLHAHAGSGIRTPEAWSEVAIFLGEAAERFPDVRALDVGGGLGVPERPGQQPLDLTAVDEGLRRVRSAMPHCELWIEPGRYLVAEAGVLLARVTQVKRKGEVTYVGAETGMNSLIRPALYGAYHPIVNLSRLDEPATLVAHVVGPICETGDILGRSRRLPPTDGGDVLLIANAGAYGRVMSSWYNLREPAGEVMV